MTLSNYIKPIKIFIIDSGIDSNISDLKKYVEKSTGFGINSNGNIVEDKSRTVNHLHGTAVAMIIRDIFDAV